MFGHNKNTSNPAIVVTESNLLEDQGNGSNKRRRISASSSDSGLDDAASLASSGNFANCLSFDYGKLKFQWHTLNSYS